MSSDINTEQMLAIIKELKGHDEKQAKWYVGPLVTIIIAAIGVFVSWGMMMKTTEFMQERLDRAEGKIASYDLEITQLKISQTKNDTMLVQIKETVADIKADVGKLLNRQSGGRRHEP